MTALALMPVLNPAGEDFWLDMFWGTVAVAVFGGVVVVLIGMLREP